MISILFCLLSSTFNEHYTQYNFRRDSQKSVKWPCSSKPKDIDVKIELRFEEATLVALLRPAGCSTRPWRAPPPQITS